MLGMVTRIGWLAALPLAGAALIAVASAAVAQQQPKDGEQVMNASCDTACHNTRPIQTSAKDEAGWKKTMKDMLDRGAMISDADQAILVPYLVRTHGPIPEGRGKDVVLNICTMCHDLTRIKRVRHTEDEWDEILVTMLNEGAPLSDDDFQLVLSYLTRNFGVN
jgi:cytochrome c5